VSTGFERVTLKILNYMTVSAKNLNDLSTKHSCCSDGNYKQGIQYSKI